MNSHTDVLVIGAGPAGIATAIAAIQNGLRVTVLDARTPPIDKPCGEGLLPHGVAALRGLGVHLDSNIAVPFDGIRFTDADSSVCAEFPGAPGFSLRRVRLHRLLVERAINAGVIFHWGVRVTQIDSHFVTASDRRISYTWLVGADGQNSTVRKWARLEPPPARRIRFGFRRHYQVSPWTSVVEVHWAHGCQIVVTPTGARELGVAVLSDDSRLRLDQALPLFPALARKLRGAIPTTKELGDATSLNRLPAVSRGRVALVGDASGTVDAITGQGLSVAFEQAIHLGEAFGQGSLGSYETAHRNMAKVPAVMTHLMLLMGGNDWIRRRTLRLFMRTPSLLSKLISIHAGALPFSSVGVVEMVDLGWKLLWA